MISKIVTILAISIATIFHCVYGHDTDPYENNNIVAAHPDVVKRLMTIWDKGNTGVYDKTDKK